MPTIKLKCPKIYNHPPFRLSYTYVLFMNIFWYDSEYIGECTNQKTLISYAQVLKPVNIFYVSVL